MKLTSFILLVVIIITAIGFSALIYYSLIRVEPQYVSEEAKEGKRIWEENGCMECHAILGNGGYSAPELTDVISRRGEEWIEGFLLEAPVVRPSKRKRHLQLKGEKQQNILAYFRLIAEINTLGWPPSPKIKIGEQTDILGE